MDKVQLGKLTLYNGDNMELLKSLPDNAFELAIVDPPYGDAEGFGRAGDERSRIVCSKNSRFEKYKQTDKIGGGIGTDSEGCLIGTRKIVNHAWGGRFQRYQYEEEEHGLPSMQNQAKTETIPNKPKSARIDWDIAPSEEYFNELFRVSRNQIIWGGNYFLLPPTRCFLVWRKLSISENFSMAMAEYAWTSFNANAKVFECAPQGDRKDIRFHPTQKPVKLYRWILNNYAHEGDKILDTHLGSGSIAIACHDLGYEFTGIEINKTYFDKSVKRIKQYQQQLSLF